MTKMSTKSLPRRPVLRPVPRLVSGLAAVVALWGLVLAAVSPAAAQTAAQAAPEQPIVADLSKHLVAITTGFAGTDVLLFGATDGPGDIILVVRGPQHGTVVRRKERAAGIIWANKDSVTFENAPAFYHVASSRPLDDIAPEGVLQRHQIGAANLDLSVDGLDEGESRAEFRDALVRLKTDKGLYGYEPGAVNMLANRLFRAELRFPANVPTGTYMVEVYLVRNGEVISAEITPLIISKVGIGADVFQFAHEQSALYGIAAILIAVAAGWLAGVAFRKS